MTTDIGKTDIAFGQLIRAENLRITFTDKKKPMDSLMVVEDIQTKSDDLLTDFLKDIQKK